MSIAIAPAANTAANAMPLRSVYAANAAAVAPAVTPAAQTPVAPAQAERGREVPAVAPTAETVHRANAAAYDCRVTGASDSVRSFDRVAMVKEGFEHMRALFEIANGGEKTPAFAGIDTRV